MVKNILPHIVLAKVCIAEVLSLLLSSPANVKNSIVYVYGFVKHNDLGDVCMHIAEVVFSRKTSLLSNQQTVK